MRKVHRLKKLAKAGLSVNFADDDPNGLKSNVVHHPPRLESNLARARNYVQKGQTELGLAELNELAISTTGLSRKAQITALVGDGAYKIGRYENAILAYQSAANQAEDHPRAWVRPALAEVRVLLKIARVDDACIKAEWVWQKSAAQHEETLRAEALQAAHIQQGNKILIKQRPYRASVIATRLGHLFLLEGEHESAKQLFTKALSINPQGASRARQGMAVIALAEGNYIEAERRSREALLVGRFQAKTLCVWSTLIAARKQQGLAGIDPELTLALNQISSSTVKARAVLCVVKALRGFQDLSWMAIADQWINQEGFNHTVVATEICKIKLTSAVSSGNLIVSSILQFPGISKSEYLQISKKVIERLPASTSAGVSNAILNGAALRFGRNAKAIVAHSLGMTCLKLQKQDVAKLFFQTSIASGVAGSTLWAKSTFRIASIQYDAGEFANSMAAYMSLVGFAKLPPRAKLRASLKAYDCAIKIGNPILREARRVQVFQSISAIQDPESLLDIAREIYRTGDETYLSVVSSLFSRGKASVLSLIDNATTPTEKLKWIFVLARRQFDFEKFSEIVTMWQNLGDLKTQLWTTSARYWEYVTIVYRSYLATNPTSASGIFTTYYNDPATPPVGRVMLGVEGALNFITNGQIDNAWPIFDEIVQKYPNAPRNAISYYWLAIRALRSGDVSSAAMFGRKVSDLIGSDSSYKWQQLLLQQAECLKTWNANGQITADLGSGNDALAQINADLTRQ